jgi:hypothetical protein
MKKEVKVRIEIGELFLVLGVCLFTAGSIGFIAGYLSQEQIPDVGALALMFVGVGASTRTKRREK